MTAAIDNFLPLQSALANAPSATRCAHCNLAVPSGLVDPDSDIQFCCAGCRAVYHTLHACGLSDYYRLRDVAEAATKPVARSDCRFESFDSPAFHRLYVQNHENGLASVDLALEGVSCAACVWLIERLPRVVEGVAEARLSLRDATVRVTWNPQVLPLSRIGLALDRFGHTPHPARDAIGKQLHQRESRRRLVHLGVAGAIMGNTMLLAFALYSGDLGHMESSYRMVFRWMSAALAMVSLSWPGATFFRSAWAAIRARTTNLDVPIAAALVVGSVAGLINVALNRGEIYFDSLTVLIFLLLVGRFIQYRQQRRADDAVGLLFNLTPCSCHLVRGESVIDAPAEALQIGDVVEVRPGELFPADGVVKSGKSSVNQALLTGESMPVGAEAGAAVHAGSQNICSALRVRVTGIGKETRVGKLMQLIERGISDKAPIVQFADRVGGWFLVVLTIVAAVVFGYWSRVSLIAAIDHTVALLIVTCPCVLGLATPLTIAIAIGRLAHRDILVKNGAALEQLSRSGDLLLDKTGTLTEGRMQLLNWTGLPEWRGVVAELERRSNHPVGRALYAALGKSELPDAQQCRTNVTERGDGGISATLGDELLDVGSPTFAARIGIAIPQTLHNAIRDAEKNGETAVVVAANRVAVAVAAMGDGLRAASAESIARLRKMGWRPEILSGDAHDVVARIAEEVGIDAHLAQGPLSPEQKLQRVERRTSRGATVMVGDGVNDAAALAAADVGIAVHGGAEASLAAADVYIAHPGLEPLVDLITTSRRTMRIIHRNLAISLAYNVLAGFLAAAGIMTPMIAAILMPISSATVLSLAVASLGRDCRK